jgi:hypothetical protein
MTLIGLNPKSTCSEHDRQRMIVRAAWTARTTLAPTLIGFGVGKPIGWMLPGRHPSAVYYRAGFTTYDDLVGEIRNGKRYPAAFVKVHSTAMTSQVWFDLWPIGVSPLAGLYPGAAFTATKHDDTETGALWHDGNKSTDTKHIVQMLGYTTATPNAILLYDRVLTYEACTFNAAVNQAMTNGVTAARYVTAGDSGLQIILTVQTLTGATGANLTVLTYVNVAGGTNVISQTPVPAIQTAAATPTNTLGARVICNSTFVESLFLPLASQDTGIKSITNYTTSAANSGTMCFILARPLFSFTVPTSFVPTQIEGLVQYTNLERVYDGACLSLLAMGTGGAPSIFGGVDVAWG